MLEIDAMRRALKANLWPPAARRNVVRRLWGRSLSERQAIKADGMSPSTVRYQSRNDGNGRKIKSLGIVDVGSPQTGEIALNTSIPAPHLSRMLDQVTRPNAGYSR